MLPFVWHEFPTVHGAFTVAATQSFTQFGEFQGIFVRPIGVHDRYPLAWQWVTMGVHVTHPFKSVGLSRYPFVIIPDYPVVPSIFPTNPFLFLSVNFVNDEDFVKILWRIAKLMERGNPDDTIGRMNGV